MEAPHSSEYEAGRWLAYGAATSVLEIEKGMGGLAQRAGWGRRELIW